MVSDGFDNSFGQGSVSGHKDWSVEGFLFVFLLNLLHYCQEI